MKRIKIIVQMIIIVFAVVVCTTMGVFAAKNSYVSTDYKLTYVSEDTSKFYFTVDLFGNVNLDNSQKKTLSLYGGEDKNVGFSVQNYFDALRINQQTTSYKISVSCSDENYTGFNLTDGTGESVTDTVYEIAGQVQSENSYNLSILSGYKNETAITVTVNTISPYKKTFILEIKLFSDDSPLLYMVDDSAGAPYATLHLLANEQIDAGTVIVKLSSVNTSSNILLVDSTNNYVLNDDQTMPNSNYEGDILTNFVITKPLKKNQGVEIILFKTKTQINCSKGDMKLSADVLGGNMIITIEIEE